MAEFVKISSCRINLDNITFFDTHTGLIHFIGGEVISLASGNMQELKRIVDEKTKKGLWIYNTDDFTPKMRCSECGYNKPIAAGENVQQEPSNFCCNCGAEMDVASDVE